MSGLSIGEVAPSFRLPSGQGSDIGPEDYRGRSNLIVWFTKGMGCSFCRSHMSQLARGYPQFRQLETEILEVTPTYPARAKIYVNHFRIPFPYLCDPDMSVWGEWGLDVQSHPIGWYVKKFIEVQRAPKPPSDYGEVEPSLREIRGLMKDNDMGFFILDRNGVVRYSLGGTYGTEQGVRQIPTNEEIIRELRRCEEGAAVQA
jgi:peroxiredoxin